MLLYNTFGAKVIKIELLSKKKNRKNLLCNKKVVLLSPASPTRPAPEKSSRVGTQQRYSVVAVRCR